MSDDLNDLRKQIAKISGSIERMAGTQKIILFSDFASEYLAEKIANPSLRSGTKKSFELQTRKHLIPAFGHLEVGGFTNSIWLTWVNVMKSRALGHRQGLNRFFNARKVLVEILGAAKERDLIEKVPKLDTLDERKNVGRVLEDSEIFKIIWHSRRPFRLIFYSFWKMGCRPREILSWEWSMIEWKDKAAWINVPARISKTGRSRSIPINSDLSKYLAHRKGRGKLSTYVFPGRYRDEPQLSYQSAWKRVCIKSGIKNATPYDFRRTFITRAASSGKPLLYIARFLDTSVGLIENVYAKSNANILEEIAR